MKHLLFLGITFAVFHISHSTVQDFCRLPSAEGTGMEFHFAFYYDMATDRCTPFLYKGEGGNANRFTNERECIRNCSINAEDIYPTDARKACHFKHARGECSGSFLRYYYDPIHDKCKKFIWTGCIGNGNRFLDMTSCNTTCEGIHDDGTEEEEEEPDTPIAIICGVLLAIIVVVIIITVVVLTVQSKKKKKGAGKTRDAKSESPLRDPGIEMSLS